MPIPFFLECHNIILLDSQKDLPTAAVMWSQLNIYISFQHFMLFCLLNLNKSLIIIFVIDIVVRDAIPGEYAFIWTLSKRGGTPI